jgi:hypothetical protein
LSFSEELSISVLALAVGVEAVDVRVGEGVERINNSEGVEIGPIGYGLSASEIILNQILSVAAEIVQGVYGVRQRGSECG